MRFEVKTFASWDRLGMYALLSGQLDADNWHCIYIELVAKVIF